MLEKAQGNTAETDEQLPEAVDQRGLPTIVTDEAEDPTVFPNIVKGKKSFSSFVQRVVYMKVRFMFSA